jgi:RNA polymerase sigma factor (sigma-70 family)
VNDPEERFAALYDRHYRRVLGYVLLRAEHEVAEDVSSETFLVAWRRLDEMPEHTLPWLLGVARNLLAKQRDSRQRRRALLDRITAGAAPHEQLIGDVAEQVADKDAALTALASMPEKDLEAMALATWHGLDPEESAAVMGCSVRAYHARLHRARKRLATAFSESENRPSVRNARHRPVREI